MNLLLLLEIGTLKHGDGLILIIIINLIVIISFLLSVLLKVNMLSFGRIVTMMKMEVQAIYQLHIKMEFLIIAVVILGMLITMGL